MKLEEYTEDVVCFAMGLVQFLPSGTGNVVRLLCRPSFHPEVCVTVTPTDVVTVALHSGLWHEPSAARMPEFSEHAAVSTDDFEGISHAFNATLAESRRPPKLVVICDGMTASAVRTVAGQSERYSGHAVNDEERRLVKTVLSLALSKARSVQLRNRIAWCGRYVSLQDDPAFPVEPEPSLPQPRVSRLLVLGTPEDRASFHALSGARAADERTT